LRVPLQTKCVLTFFGHLDIFRGVNYGTPVYTKPSCGTYPAI
jgi:hypothetical protein